MPRTARIAPGGIIFYVLNRANQRAILFEQPADYDAFERVIGRTLAYVPMRILSYCDMPKHWHFVLWPEQEGELPAFMHRLTTTHARRRHLYRRTVGEGHLYQARSNPFPSRPMSTC